jgi:Pyruvate/2-oxoacid:ferredoxin oxidoreductase gamma subunit
MVPFTVSVGSDLYPRLDDVFSELERKTDLYKVDALQIARDAGAAITKNTVMLGTLAATEVLPFDAQILLDTILHTVPAKFKTINEQAFQGGIEAIQSR